MLSVMSNPLTPEAKKAYLNKVGKKLVERHGKKKYYSRKEVEGVIKLTPDAVNLAFLAYGVFTNQETFQHIHQETEKGYSYEEMRRDALSALTDSGSYLDIDLDLSWLDWPDIDLGSVFDWFSAS